MGIVVTIPLTRGSGILLDSMVSFGHSTFVLVRPIVYAFLMHLYHLPSSTCSSHVTPPPNFNTLSKVPFPPTPASARPSSLSPFPPLLRVTNKPNIINATQISSPSTNSPNYFHSGFCTIGGGNLPLLRVWWWVGVHRIWDCGGRYKTGGGYFLLADR